jgi:HSP20 family protein
MALMEVLVMNLQKLNPWNWFKHEESAQEDKAVVPVKRGDYSGSQLAAPSLQQLHHEIDRLFDDAFRNFGFPSLSRSPLWDQMLGSEFASSFQASLNVASDDEKYAITLEAPGLEQKDISLELKERVLVIKGNKQEETEDKEKQFYRIERRYGSFERVLSVPDDGDVEKISASMKNGLLTIQIPRLQTAKSEIKKITINEG